MAFKPDSRGKLVDVRTPAVFSAHRPLTPYTKVSPLLVNLDALLEGKKPRICITRRQGGIGDVLMTLPTVRAVAQKYNTKVDYGTDFNYLDGALPKVLLDNPYIETVKSYNEVDPEDYHAVLDLTCPCVAHEQPRAIPINRIDLFARHLRIPLTDHSIDYHVRPEEEKWAQEYLTHYNLDRFSLVMVNPSSSTSTRDCPSDKLRQALSGLISTQRDIRLLVIVHDSDPRHGENWNFAETHVLKNLDVRQLAVLLTRCKLLICPDSAMLHVASALHHPTLTIFGPTDPRARINYHPEAVAIWPVKGLANYPCWYKDPCDGWICWKRLDPNLITLTAMAILSKQTLPNSEDLVTFGQYKMEEKHYQIV